MAIHAKKRSVVVNGKKTSVSMDDGTWGKLVALARAKNTTINELVSQVQAAGAPKRLSAALREVVA